MIKPLEPLRSLDDFATHLGRSRKTAERRVGAAMKADPGLHVTKDGRTMKFTAAQWDRLFKALEWRPAAVDLDLSPVSRPGLWKVNRNRRTAREMVEELTRKPAKAASGTKQ